MNFCREGGWVCGPTYPFPTSAASYYVVESAIVPCNQLCCERCSAPVRHMDGVKMRAPGDREHARLYDSLDPDDWLPFVAPSSIHRFYFCRCAWYSSAGATPAQDLDTRHIDHWACAGHPVVAVS